MIQLHVSNPVQGVTLLEINSPPVNALGYRLRQQIEDAVDEAEQDLSIRVLVITGRGKGFSAGDDLNEEKQRSLEIDDDPSAEQFTRLLGKLERLRIPVIAAVNGYAIGGGMEFALACDIRIASEHAYFQGAAVNVGLLASSYRLPRLIGAARAKSMLMTGEKLPIEEALAYGMITEVCSVEELMSVTLRLAERIATRAPLSIEATKRMIGKAHDLSPAEAELAQWDELRLLRKSKDHKLAVESFLLKKTPKFTRQ